MYSLIGGTTLVQNSKIVKEGNAANLQSMANSHRLKICYCSTFYFVNHWSLLDKGVGDFFYYLFLLCSQRQHARFFFEAKAPINLYIWIVSAFSLPWSIPLFPFFESKRSDIFKESSACLPFKESRACLPFFKRNGPKRWKWISRINPIKWKKSRFNVFLSLKNFTKTKNVD